MKEEIKIHNGTPIWKSHIEYFNEYTVLHGFPCYRITEINDEYYLWELDREVPDSRKYNILKTSRDFDLLYEEGMKLQNDRREELYPETDRWRMFEKELPKREM